jgi:Protein of unknown function (DUF3108)
MKRAVLLLLALCAPWTAGAATATLAPFKATYGVRYSGMNAGTGQLELLQVPGGLWALESRVEGHGLARIFVGNELSRSEFRIENDKVVPMTFTSDENTQKLVFDWQSGRVTGAVERKPVNLPLQPGLLDPLSVQVALMHELNSGRMPERFTLVDEDRIKDYLYAVEGSEVIDSVAGSHRTDIYSSRRPGSKKATYFWCAPDLGNIPLKVERRDGRDVVWSMRLTELQR